MEVCSSLSCAWSWLGSNASSVIALSALATAGALQIIELAFIVPGQAACDEVPQRFAQSIGARIVMCRFTVSPGSARKASSRVRARRNHR
jgi:hypothetical protein